MPRRWRSAPAAQLSAQSVRRRKLSRIPSVDLYLDHADGQRLLDWLNSEDEIAFVLQGAGAPPRLSGELAHLTQGNHLLFHTSYTSIPTYPPLSQDENAVSQEIYSLMKLDAPEPLSGADEGHPAIFAVCIRYTQRVANREGIGLSHIAWIGSRYASLGIEVTAESKRWWKRLNSWIARNARKISRSGPLDDYSKNSWAWVFPSALASIEAGTLRAENPPS